MIKKIVIITLCIVAVTTDRTSVAAIGFVGILLTSLYDEFRYDKTNKED